MMRRRRKPELVEWIKRLEIGPNDTLALKVNRPLSAEAVAHLREQIASALPKGTSVLLISYDLHLTVIGRQARDRPA